MAEALEVKTQEAADSAQKLLDAAKHAADCKVRRPVECNP